MDPKQAQASHFSFSGLHLAAKLSPAGSGATPALFRIDFAPNGTITPHYHLRASEILVFLEGSLFIGFITSNPDNKLVTKVLNKGDVSAGADSLPAEHLGMEHCRTFQACSQNPGLVLVANTVFGSKPPVSADILAKAFQTDMATVPKIQAKF